MKLGLLVALLLWSMAAMLLRTREVAARPISVPLGPALLWRSGSIHVDRWSEFLKAVEARVPEGSTILVTSHEIDPADEFFLGLWAAYFLPRHNVVRADSLRQDQPRPRYVLTTNGEASLLALKTGPTGGSDQTTPSSAEGQAALDSMVVLLDSVGRLLFDATSAPRLDRPPGGP